MFCEVSFVAVVRKRKVMSKSVEIRFFNDGGETVLQIGVTLTPIKIVNLPITNIRHQLVFF